MLAKKYRLSIQTVSPERSRGAVLNKRSRNFKSRCFLFKIFMGLMDHNRFGVIISKKVDKSAVERNRLKRIIFDSVKKFIRQPADGENKGKYDILIIVSPTVAKLAKADIIKEIGESLREIIGN